MKRLLEVVFMFSVVFIFLALGFANADEQLTISTYYPSPYGSYKNLSVSNWLAVGPVTGTDIWGSAGSVPGAIVSSGGAAMVLFMDRNLTSYPTTPAAGNGYAWYDQSSAMRLWTYGTGDIVRINSSGFITQYVSTTYPNGCYMMTFGSNSGRTQCPTGSVNSSITTAASAQSGVIWCCQ